MEIRSVLFLLFFVFVFSKSSFCQSYYTTNWDPVLIEDGFEGELDWVKFEEIVDPNCYREDIGALVRSAKWSHSGDYSLEVAANRANEPNSNHVIAGRKIFDAGVLGYCTYSLYGYVPLTGGQTGPEFSVQNTRFVGGQNLTFTAGIQYVSNPGVGSGGQWNVWNQGQWEACLVKPLKEGVWYRFELAFRYTDAANPYEYLVIEELGETADTIDLSSFSISGEAKGFEPALWVTLEAENLWTNCTERNQYSVFYDDIRLNCRSEVAPACSVLIGELLDPVEQLDGWRMGKGNGGIDGSLNLDEGVEGKAIRLSYDLGDEPNAWVQLIRDFDQPVDISGKDHLRFFYRGTARNSLEVGIILENGQLYFTSKWNDVTHLSRFTYATFDLRDFRKDGLPLPGDAKIKSIFFSVTLKDQGVGGKGELLLDELQLLQLSARPVPEEFERIHGQPEVAAKAADWIGMQLQPCDLLRSWTEESELFVHNAWLYDQAIGLIVLSETEPDKAAKLAQKLVELQNPEGSWYAGYDYQNNMAISSNKPVGAISWTVYALSRYYSYSSDQSAWEAAQKGVTWLAGLQRTDGSLPAEPGQAGAPTEPNLDAWWAFYATQFDTEAEKLKNYLLEKAWDNSMGRFKADASSFSIFLDNQTWGACFLIANGLLEEARKALSYARSTLVTHHTAGETICGLDGAGPFGLWNEGSLQYIVAGGENSSVYWEKILPQQQEDGSMPGAWIDFSGYIVWLSRWRGIAPTCWLYFAANGGPFVAELKTGVRVRERVLPEVRVSPNPISDKTVLRFQLSTKRILKIQVYDRLGQVVTTLWDGLLPAGEHTIAWDGRGAAGSYLPNGTYFFVLRDETHSLSGKIIVMRR